ncbi:MAG: hypothetical protein EXR93_09800 [Gemmatimonadetes bacterium]|nr:hypothetical protein [Gemmatimonadota bacterium]
MTSSTIASSPRYDARTVVVGGIQIGAATAGGVVLFALLSRAMTGTAEAIVQSLLVLAGGALVTYWPAAIVRPREVDTIGWTSLLGYVGAVTFTIADIALLRPVHLYHWTWDAIGGGSGFWYLPIWWMGATFLAGVGATVYSYQPPGAGPKAPRLAGETVAIAVVLFGVITGFGILPVHASVVALSYASALVMRAAIAAWQSTR